MYTGILNAGIHHAAEDCQDSFWCAIRKATEAIFCCNYRSGLHLYGVERILSHEITNKCALPENTLHSV